MAKGTVLIVVMLRGEDLEILQLSGNLVTTCTVPTAVIFRYLQILSTPFVCASYESHNKQH